ncbi:PucR family transcriptional regulator [Rhodococcus sp. NPDC057529]|uniref:PucR family transcriptional regulator n=1 Tax=Rhodococcus sp. NPDC057529 TaxID=3346158 RepID=UPI00366F8589
MEAQADTDLKPASDPAVVEGWIRALGRGPTSWVVELAYETARLVAQKEPELSGSDDGFQTLRLGTESGIMQMLEAIVSPVGVHPFTAPEGALIGGRVWARRRIRLDSVLRAFRIGHSIVSDRLLNAVEGSPHIRDEVARADEMARVSRVLFEYIDHFSSAMTEEYNNEQVAWLGSQDAKRLSLVESVLEGVQMDSAEASAALGYDLRQRHLALVLTAESHQVAQAHNLARLAKVLAQSVGDGGNTLVVQPGPTTAWAWTSIAGDMPTDPIPAPTGTRVSLGSPERGQDGFCATHLQAISAESIAVLTDRQVAYYSEVEIGALTVGNLELARRFIFRELEGVMSDDAAVLRSTLLAYLEARGSVSQAARALLVSKNTVTYRIHNAEAALGHSVRDRSFELLLALKMTEALGASVFEL